MPTSEILSAARQQVRQGLAVVESQLAQLADDQAGDTKSSAGDKFETSREMIQQELDRLEGQARVLQEQLLQLEMAERADASERATIGSVVRVATGERYLLACGIGRVKGVEGGPVYSISLESPLGAALAGVRAGEEVVFRGKRLTVVSD